MQGESGGNTLSNRWYKATRGWFQNYYVKKVVIVSEKPLRIDYIALFVTKFATMEKNASVKSSAAQLNFISAGYIILQNADIVTNRF